MKFSEHQPTFFCFTGGVDWAVLGLLFMKTLLWKASSTNLGENTPMLSGRLVLIFDWELFKLFKKIVRDFVCFSVIFLDYRSIF